jgi:lipopolysaccharide export system permease protein
MVFIFIIMAARMMDIIDLMVNQGISANGLAKMIMSMLPQIVLFSLPAACLMSAMLSFIRLASDNEIIALNASGVSLFQMLPPVIFFSLVSYIAAGLMAIYGVPWGNRYYQDSKQMLTKSKTSLTPPERIFYNEIDNFVFYVNSSSTREGMKDIFIVDKSNKKLTTTIVAESGMIVTGTTPNTYNLHLNNGTSFTSYMTAKAPGASTDPVVEKASEAEKNPVANEIESGKVSVMTFPTLDYPIALGDIESDIASREKKPKEMYLRELRSRLREEGIEPSKRNEMGIKLYEMFSIPLAIFILGIIGAYLGSHVRARGRTAGIIVSLIIFLIYYISLMGSRYLCEMGVVAPAIGVWSPVLLLLIISLFFLSRVKKTGAFTLFH